MTQTNIKQILENLNPTQEQLKSMSDNMLLIINSLNKLIKIDVDHIMNTDLLSIWITLLLIYVGFLITETKLKPILKHPRIIKRIVLFFILSVLYISFEALISNCLILKSGLFAISVIAIYTIWFPLFTERLFLRMLFLNKRIKTSTLHPNNKFYRIFLTTKGKIHFYKKIIHFSQNSEYRHSIPHHLLRLESLKLFDKELVEVQKKKGYFYLEWGAHRALKNLIEDAKTGFKETMEYSYFNAEFCRINLDSIGWRNHLLEAERKLKSNSSKNSHKVLLYNNLAVASLKQGNREDHKRYLLESLRNLDQSDTNKHNVFPNYIDNLLITKEKGKYQQALEQYEKLINFEDFHDVLAWYNYKIAYHRQLSNPSEVCTLIDEMSDYFENKFDLDSNEKALLSISGLRMQYNGNCDWQPLFVSIVRNIDYYMNLQPETSFQIVKELIGIMSMQQQLEFTFNGIDRVLDAIVKFLKEYIKVVDDRIDTLKLEFVYERCQAIDSKVFIISIIANDKDPDELIESIIRKIGLYNDLVLIYTNENNKLFELNTRLLIVDEIGSFDRSAKNAPIPFKVAFLTLKEDKKQELKQHLEKCWTILTENSFDLSNFDADINDKLIVLGYYLSKELNDISRAEVLFNKFESSGISLQHYAQWLINMYYELKRSL